MQEANEPLKLLPRFEPVALMENMEEDNVMCDICMSVDWEEGD
jgi:hypothetical protein